MMEQMDMFSLIPTEEWAFNLLRPSLLNIIAENNANTENLICKEGKNYSSVWFSKQLAFRICCRDDKCYFGVSIDFTQSAPIEVKATQSHSVKNEGFYNFEFEPTHDGVMQFAAFLCSALDQAIDSTPKEFDCCSRFEECSNCKRCINPNPDLAVGCGYRKILKSGRIYYGKNKNI